MVSERRAIDANALQRKLVEMADFYDADYLFVDAVMDEIDNAPTVDAVEVVHGRWHDVYLMTPWIATGICSHCNLKSYINPDFPFAKYCPNCGAKMDGDGNA